MGTPPVDRQIDGQMRVKTLPSHRTPYAGGKNNNKKVLLRERKRHTARRVVSTPNVVLAGYPPCPDLARGDTLWGVPYLGTPWAGYPPAGYPPPPPPGRAPPPAGPGRVLLWLDLAGYPPRCLPHGILGNVAKHYGIWVPPQV